MSSVVCVVPVEDGTQMNQLAWGMYEKAKKLSEQHSAKLLGIIIHTGLNKREIESLPLDEVYQIKIEKKLWYLPEARLKACERIIKDLKDVKEKVFFFSSDPIDQEIAIRLSYQTEAVIVTNILGIEYEDSSFLVQKSIYGNKAHEWIRIDKNKELFLTFDPSILYGKKVEGTAAKVREFPFSYDNSGKITFLHESILTLEELRITEARCVIGVGRGVHGHDPGAFESIVKLSKLLNAPIGGSKVADELNLIPREMRIGSSGHSIDADIYIAIGISGSSQHLAGINGVKHVIAINSDAAAPIFKRSEIGIVGDFRKAVSLLYSALEAERGGEQHD